MFLWTLVYPVTECFLVVNVLLILFGQHGLYHVNHWSQSLFQCMDPSPHSYNELGVTDDQVLGYTHNSFRDWILPESLNFLTWVFLFLLPWLSLLTPTSVKEIFISLPLYSNRQFQKLKKYPKSFKWIKNTSTRWFYDHIKAPLFTHLSFSLVSWTFCWA